MRKFSQGGVLAVLVWVLAIIPGGAIRADSTLASSVSANPHPTASPREHRIPTNPKRERTGEAPSPSGAAPTTPLISIIVDDLGHLRVAGLQAIDLPGNLSFSFIPNAPYARALADVARARGKEILLHIPMESRDGRDLGPGGLTKEMTRAELTESVCASIRAIPYARGLSNHMGSLLTRRKEPMRWLMAAMLECGPGNNSQENGQENGKGLYFVDSLTTGGTVAAATARTYHIPTLERDVFLDHDPDPEAILAGLRQLVRKAKEQGTALGIAHPYPETLAVLGRVLPQLEGWGVVLVPVSVLLANR
uniref:Divergent polysaccharide deacetylase n=1 Tax=Candidatus Kentrum eta TaxID=2126337 RepID=A0A450ULS9_9GAMM|nr:MAG: hypothetical protein BECKH772A_GA0070896_1005713 [Candidatus Kentron sp. H]VFJ94307.1 MAG: hypothetical protein BECKH772B_GA0070898_1005912 [Candidatus Kentron sp. H]VFK00940.1 MAG: hypothetical protein BECKH772C_GA0070978_1005513 [Candidatus Kentron sp. H]